jgi:hypothetical protein
VLADTSRILDAELEGVEDETDGSAPPYYDYDDRSDGDGDAATDGDSDGRD